MIVALGAERPARSLDTRTPQRSVARSSADAFRKEREAISPGDCLTLIAPSRRGRLSPIKDVLPGTAADQFRKSIKPFAVRSHVLAPPCISSRRRRAGRNSDLHLSARAFPNSPFLFRANDLLFFRFHSGLWVDAGSIGLLGSDRRRCSVLARYRGNFSCPLVARLIIEQALCQAGFVIENSNRSIDRSRHWTNYPWDPDKMTEHTREIFVDRSFQMRFGPNAFRPVGGTRLSRRSGLGLVCRLAGHRFTLIGF